MISDRLITGITYTSNIVQLKLKKTVALPNDDLELRVFKSLANDGISVDFINVQSEWISFTVTADLAEKALSLLHEIGVYPEIEYNCAKVAVVGAAMTGIPGVMAQVVEALITMEYPSCSQVIPIPIFGAWLKKNTWSWQ